MGYQTSMSNGSGLLELIVQETMLRLGSPSYSDLQTLLSSIMSLPADCFKGPLKGLVVKGNTLVNLAAFGGCESTDGWSTSQASIAVDSNNAFEGINCIKLTITAGQTIGYAHTDILSLLDTSKHYLIAAHLKNGDLSGNGITVFVNCIGDAGILHSEWITGTSYKRAGLVLQPSDFNEAGAAILNLYIDGVTGEYGFIDAISILEISAAEYAEGASDIDALMSKKPYTAPGEAISVMPHKLKSTNKNLIKNGNGENGANFWEQVVGTTGDFEWDDTESAFRFAASSENLYVIQNVYLKAGQNYSWSINKKTTVYDSPRLIILNPFDEILSSILITNSADYAIQTETFTPMLTGWHKIRFSLASETTRMYVKEISLAIGSTALEDYIAHESDDAYCPVELKKFVGTDGTIIQDKFDFKTGELREEIRNTELTGPDVVAYYDTPTNVDLVCFSKPVNASEWINGIDKKTNFEDREEIASAGYDEVVNVGKYFTTTDQIRYIVTKGTHVDLAAAQSYYNSNPAFLDYQLAQPVSHEVVPQSLTGFPSGALTAIPTVEFAAQPVSGVLTIPNNSNSRYHINSIVKIIRSDTGEIITADSFTDTTITLPAGYSDTVEYSVEYELKPENTTIPEVEFQYPNNLTAIVEGTVDAVAQNSGQITDIQLLLDYLLIVNT